MIENQLNQATISRIVLASSSPRRKELVASLALSLPVSILSTDTDETYEKDWTPAEVVERLSLRKGIAAEAMLAKQEMPLEGTLILAADTIVVLDGAVLGKPANSDEAAAMLTSLQGRSHDVYSGIALLEAGSDKRIVASRRTRVAMKPLSEERIRRYVASGEPMDKAGAYGIQGLGAALVEGIEGCYFNVVGLPISLLTDKLELFGVRTY
ncbi:septum formation inhibitor Maf [Paenibacillus agaridevorans]|uniref:dTTP/UTP pyrophosphatase n=1 Tax=Paenibacillus agaridevorans TaxID=171404 RepID=A0A2R5ERJ5_9BACL|nr:Maf family protein [Paenibacillus agaridevorans]GBG08755.1 septum formation inhibitor Maf [Paenibacillus agaridevorans]